MSNNLGPKQKLRYIYRTPKERCSNCIHFDADVNKTPTGYTFGEKNKRCLLGGFSVRSNAICDYFDPKKKLSPDELNRRKNTRSLIQKRLGI